MNALTLLIAPIHSSEGLAGDSPSGIDVCWDPNPTELSADVSSYLEERWAHYEAQARSQGKMLFNSQITRLIGAKRKPSGPGGPSRLELCLGPAEYKNFLVSRLRDRAWFEHNAPQAMVQALGNSALLTHGDQAFLGIRSPRVSAYAGRAHLLGGVLDLLGTEQFPATVRGIISHLLKELAEEVHISSKDLASGDWPRLLSIAHDEFLGQPEAIWQWETTLPLDRLGAELDPGEHSGWVFLHRSKINDRLWEQMTPVARHAWSIWSGRYSPSP